MASERDEDAPTAVAITGKRLFKDVQRLAENYDFVVIDTGKDSKPEQRAALMLAHLALFPVAHKHEQGVQDAGAPRAHRWECPL